MQATEKENRWRLFRIRELLVFAPIYVWLSFINYAIKVWLTPSWFVWLEYNHAASLRFEFTNNEQSRLLQFYVPELFHQFFGTTIQHSYALARLTFVFLTYIVFHRYLRKWFSAAEAFAGVALLAAIIPFTHMDDLQESSPLLVLLFLMALGAIRDNRIGLMLGVFFLGGLTNETMLILPSVYFFYHLRFDSWKNALALAGKSFLVGIPLLATIGPIRYFTRNQPVLGSGYHWPDNLEGIFHGLTVNPFDLPRARYVFFILLFGILWYYAFFRYTEKPLFLRRASWMIPFFVLAHLITGKIDEPRQMIPLGFIIIPMAMFFILNKKGESTPGSSHEVDLRSSK